MSDATIFALASGAGRAGVAVVRLSGTRAAAALQALTGAPAPRPRVASLFAFRDAEGAVIDRGLALLFPAPKSFTGEDVVELHTHGGRAVLDALFARLLALGLKPAAPGTFSRRAFENGKLDLSEAEGLADLIDAETEGQRRQALRQMDGALSALCEAWRSKLLTAAALLEAEIDFPDEDLPEDVASRALPPLRALAGELRAHLADGARGERVREGYRVAILGAPNAGKSSLLNALARRDAAIVSAIPGTTRDVVEVRIELSGFPVWIADTAGLRETADAIESEGVRRALERAEGADLRIGVVDPREGAPQALTAALRQDDLLIHSKCDLTPGDFPYHSGQSPEGAEPGPRSRRDFAVSTVTGEGLAELEAALAARVARDLASNAAPPLSRARHRDAVMDALAALERAVDAFAVGPELAAEDVRLAARALGRIAGKIDVEAILGEIFASFCIGK